MSSDDITQSAADPVNVGGLTTLFYRNGYVLIATIVVLLVGGLSALRTLPRLEDPRIDTRNALVVTPVPGASAERVDTLVTEVLEKALQEVPEIDTLESISRSGVSVISLQLSSEVDASTNTEVFSEIRDKLGAAKRDLPAEALTSRFDDQLGAVGFTLITAVTWNAGGTESEEQGLGILDRLAEDLGNRLRAVPGTELVRLYGAPEEEITVTLNSAAVAELGLSATAVARRVAGGDAKGSAGVVRAADSNLQVEVAGELTSIDRVASVPVGVGTNGEVVRLGALASIERRPRQPADDIAMVDGRRAVLVAARTVPNVRVDQWADQARQVLADFEASVGRGITVEPIFEQERYTSAQLTNLSRNLVAGMAVIMAVILVMMGWRLALVVGLALPLVVAAVLLGWQITGTAIHQMSIFGLIIALGLLIDNAIVLADEVAKEVSKGASRVQAVDRAVRHLAVPLLSSTLTTCLAFAPILLLSGNIGDFIGSIGSSVVLAIVASYALALTVTASLAGRFVTREPSEPDAERRPFWRHGIDASRWIGGYRRALTSALRYPVATMLIALFLPLAGFVVARSLGNDFFPPVDRDLFQVRMWLPVTSSIDHTRDQAQAAEALIRDMPGVERVFWLVGGSFPTVYYNLIMDQDDSPYYAQAIVQAESSRAAKAMIDDLQASFTSRFPEAQLLVRQFGQGPPIDADVEFRLYGPDLARLQDLGDDIRMVLQQHPEVLISRTSLPRGEPKLWLDADQDEASLAGFALTEIAGQMRANLDGGVGGSVVEDREQLPIRVRYDDQARSRLDHVASMPLVPSTSSNRVPGTTGWVPLEAIGELKLRPELGAISRYNGERVLRVQAWTDNEALPIEVTNTVRDQLAASGFELPNGYRFELGGAAAEDAAAKEQLAAYVPLLVVLTVATLVLSFGSLRLALLLLSVAGLSVGLGLLSTWFAGFPVSFNSLLGILGLMGVALNDSIVVLAAIRGDDRARHGDLNAIVEQVVASTRHVVSTTLTTIGGFLPLLLFVGGDFWPSLAIVLAGGIAGASIIALLLIPAVHVVLFPSRHQPARPPTEAQDSLSPAVQGGVA